MAKVLLINGSGNEHGILLTEKEEALLDRWKYADELLLPVLLLLDLEVLPS